MFATGRSNEVPKPDRVRVHRGVGEHRVGVVVFLARRLQPAEVHIGKRIPIHRGPGRTYMYSEVREPVRGRLPVERIDDMDEAELLTDPLDDVRRPGSAELDPLRRVRPEGLEESE